MKTLVFSLALTLTGIFFTAFAPAPVSTCTIPTDEVCFTINNNTGSNVTVRVGKNGQDIAISANTSANVCGAEGTKLYKIIDGQRNVSITIDGEMNTGTYNYSNLFN